MKNHSRQKKIILKKIFLSEYKYLKREQITWEVEIKKCHPCQFIIRPWKNDLPCNKLN